MFCSIAFTLDILLPTQGKVHMTLWQYLYDFTNNEFSNNINNCNVTYLFVMYC